jgi:ribosomal protein S12 methylthiotransferase accessory factor YcaO
MQTESFIVGKDASLESSISGMQAKLEALGYHIEERSWLNPVDSVWSAYPRARLSAAVYQRQGCLQTSGTGQRAGRIF